MRRCIPLLLALPLLLLVSSCDEGNPVAPSGSFLLMSANPNRIGLNGTSVITITGRRPDGNPLSDGTEIQLSTSLGTISPNIVEIGSNGTATAILQGDGRAGTADVTASVGTAGGGGGGGDGEGGGATGGPGVGSTTLSVQIGEDESTQPLVRVTVNPSTIKVGEQATVTVIAQNPDGTPLGAGQTVILTTTLGTLRPDRPKTDSTGTARSTLTASDQDGTAVITATVGSSVVSDTSTASVTIEDAASSISVQANPRTVPASGGTVNLSALVVNAQGEGTEATVVFESSKGSLSNAGAVRANNGVAENTLTLDVNDNLMPGETITVTARTPGPGGQILSATTTITVTG